MRVVAVGLPKPMRSRPVSLVMESRRSLAPPNPLRMSGEPTVVLTQVSQVKLRVASKARVVLLGTRRYWLLLKVKA